MSHRRAALVGVVASVALNGAISAVTDTATVLAVTPVGVAVYLIVGVGVPQAFVGRRTSSNTALGLGALATVAGLLALAVGALGSGVLADWGAGFVNLLLVLVLGTLLWASVAQFAEGYSSVE